METPTKRTYATTQSRAGHFAEIRQYLAADLISRAKTLNEKPWSWLIALNFLEDLPGLLGRLKVVGKEEAEEAGYNLPHCFMVRLNRISEMVKKLHENITIQGTKDWQEQTGNEAARIFSNISSHISRLIIDKNEEISDPSSSLKVGEYGRKAFDDHPIIHGSDGHIPLLRLNGAISAWNSLNSLVDDCDCSLCGSQIAKMICVNMDSMEN